VGLSDPFRAGPSPDARLAPDAAPWQAAPAPEIDPGPYPASGVHLAPLPAPETDHVPFPAPEVDPAPEVGPAPFPAPDFPASEVDPDPEWTAYVAWVDREIAAGRAQEPGPEIWDPEAWAPGDPAPIAPVRPRFGQDDEADLLPPRPLLAGLTEEAVSDLGRLSDSELVGVLQATRRQIAREQYKQVLVSAEYARRRQSAFEDAARRGVPVGCRPGGFPGDELAMELVTTPLDAGRRIDDAIDLTSRLPMTLAGMAAGLIDEARAGWIAMHTRCLSTGDAAYADEVLAAVAPDLRVDQLADRAARLAAKLDPAAVKARKERAKRCDQRVEARREASGNACLSGREMDTADVIASKAFIDAAAARLRRGGLPGSLGALRVLAMADLTQGRDPLDRLNPVAGSVPQAPGGTGTNRAKPSGAKPAGHGPTHHGPTDGPAGDEPTDAANRPVEARSPAGPHGGGVGRTAPVPLPALVNLIIPAGTLLGWSTAPAQAGALGLLDPDETRAIALAAARHSRTRWCATITADGTALAHGCARGQHPDLLDNLEPQPPRGNQKRQPPPGDQEPQPPPGSQKPQPPPQQQLIELLHRLGLAFTPVARNSCDHAQSEEQYTPSRRLSHLVRARSATCDAPGCQAQAVNADLDHTRPWPAGPTDQCNLAPRCRTHHRAKQAPDWKVEQVAPGVTRWTLPSGRTHVTTPTRYDTT
jgi:Domain of unknown function (DUF222)